MTLLLGIWNKFSTFILGALGIIVALVGFYFKAKSDGKNEVKIEAYKENAEQTKKALKTSHDIGIIGDSAVYTGLQKYTRK